MYNSRTFNTSNFNILCQFKNEWVNMMSELQEKISKKTNSISVKTYGKGIVPQVFAALFEHDRGLEVSEHMLNVCWPDEVPEVFTLILPPNRTEDIIMQAIEKCSPELIKELYLKLSPNKKKSQLIVDSILLKCPDMQLGEMLDLVMQA